MFDVNRLLLHHYLPSQTGMSCINTSQKRLLASVPDSTLATVVPVYYRPPVWSASRHPDMVQYSFAQQYMAVVAQTNRCSLPCHSTNRQHRVCVHGGECKAASSYSRSRSSDLQLIITQYDVADFVLTGELQ